MDRRCGSSDRVPALQAAALRSNPSPTKTKPNKKNLFSNKNAPLQVPFVLFCIYVGLNYHAPLPFVFQVC
jgi:hypothetical protein